MTVRRRRHPISPEKRTRAMKIKTNVRAGLIATRCGGSTRCGGGTRCGGTTTTTKDTYIV